MYCSSVLSVVDGVSLVPSLLLFALLLFKEHIVVMVFCDLLHSYFIKRALWRELARSLASIPPRLGYSALLVVFWPCLQTAVLKALV